MLLGGRDNDGEADEPDDMDDDAPVPSRTASTVTLGVSADRGTDEPDEPADGSATPAATVGTVPEPTSEPEPEVPAQQAVEIGTVAMQVVVVEEGRPDAPVESAASAEDPASVTPEAAAPADRTPVVEATDDEPAPAEGEASEPARDPAPEVPASQAEQPAPPDTPLATSNSGSDKPPTDIPPTGSSEAGEAREPMLPTTANDIKWETWHGGEVHEYGMPGTPNAEVVKVYSKANALPNNILQTPSGVTLDVADGDIVQVYTTDSVGQVSESPAHIFQGVAHLPKGYSANLLAPSDEQMRAHRTLNDFGQQVGAGRDHSPLPNQQEEDTFGSMLKTFILGGRRAWTDQTGFTPDGIRDVLVLQPRMGGKPVALISRAGYLLKGNSRDVIQVVHMPDEGGYQTRRSARLGELANEDSYIRLA